MLVVMKFIKLEYLILLINKQKEITMNFFIQMLGLVGLTCLTAVLFDNAQILCPVIFVAGTIGILLLNKFKK